MNNPLQYYLIQGCVVRLGLKIESMPKPYHIHSPGGRLITNQFVKQVPLQLQEKFFPTALIILPTQSVDIILGMNWMDGRGVLLDTTSRSVHINSSIHGSMTLNLVDHIPSTPTMNQVETKSLAEIPVVCEYPDVFPDDLPGMPPDRKIEFAIELQPGTAPCKDDAAFLPKYLF